MFVLHVCVYVYVYIRTYVCVCHSATRKKHAPFMRALCICPCISVHRHMSVHHIPVCIYTPCVCPPPASQSTPRKRPSIRILVSRSKNARQCASLRSPANIAAFWNTTFNSSTCTRRPSVRLHDTSSRPTCPLLTTTGRPRASNVCAFMGAFRAVSFSVPASRLAPSWYGVSLGIVWVYVM